jgi:hypothetical protein
VEINKIKKGEKEEEEGPTPGTWRQRGAEGKSTECN